MIVFKQTFFFAVALFLASSGTSVAHALTISPVTIELNGNPGQTVSGELELFNEQSVTKKLFSSFENFEPSGETGSPKFIGSTTGLATWMTTDTNVTLEVGQKIKVPYTITVPTDAEPGGYFSAIFWSEDNPAAQQAGDVSIGGKLGALVLFRVNGDIKEAAGISNFGFDDGSKFRTMLPLSFMYRFKNDGADRVVPLGDIVIKNTFGGITVTLPANVNEGSVLPSSIRKFQSTWGVPLADGARPSFVSIVKGQFADFHFGLYSANLSLTFGATNQIATDSFHFVFVPWQLLLVVLVLLAILVTLLKLYNRWIIAKSKSSD